MSAVKVRAEHLKRNAYLYVRQSTMRQVIENTESTRRQYELRRRAVSLGWPEERVITIDSDLGQSGASAVDRKGFQRLAAEVGMGNAGIVLGLEVSRLARNSSDWHRLLELCSYTSTLILDEDGIYDPTDFNDRLLLGLKGTMSEAELHVLQSRLRGGILNKARRGELKINLPIGFVYDQRGKVILDPDKQVGETIHLLFKTFFRLGAGMATVRYFRDKGILFPRRNNGGPHHGELVWGRLDSTQANHILHNPRYAGCYAFGRKRHRKNLDGKQTSTKNAQEQWHSMIPNAHPGYITLEQFEEIREILKKNGVAYGQDRRHGPAREGPALLQGFAICGVCGTRMTVRYHRRSEGLFPDYFCLNRGPTGADNPCQIVSGASIDKAIGRLILDALEPEAVELAMAVHDELRQRSEEVKRNRELSVERANYEANLARQRYIKVDPNNRMVADTLEAEWNNKLRELEQAQQECRKEMESDGLSLTEQMRQQITNLATELPSIWDNPSTSAKDRKRMLRLLIEDVTILKKEEITLGVRFRGGANRTIKIPLPLNAWQQRTTPPELLKQIDELLEEHCERDVAQILNKEGKLSGANQQFMVRHIYWVRYHYKLKSHKARLRERGYVPCNSTPQKNPGHIPL